MPKIADKKVQDLLDDIRNIDNEKYLTLQQCRKIVFELNPDITERIIYGGIMFNLNDNDLGGIFASKNHVSFEFTNGAKLNDPKGLFEGKGKLRRHLKLKSFDDVEQKNVAFFVAQIV